MKLYYTHVTALFLAFNALLPLANAQQVSCAGPTHFKQASTLENASGLTWSEAGSATQWKVVWGSNGIAPDNMTSSVIVNDPFAVISIPAGANHIAYVQSICGAKGSNWVGPVYLNSSSSCSTPPTEPAIFDTICGSDIASLETPSLSSAIWWYAGKPLGYGDEFESDILTTNRTYWFTPTNTLSASQEFGPTYGNQIGNFANFSNGQVITVQDTLLWDSVTLVSNGQVTYTIELWNANQTNLIQKTEDHQLDAAGEHRVGVEMILIPGTYVVKANPRPGGSALFRSTSPQQYPYVLPGLMSIDSTTTGVSNRYYYLFDMSVRTLCIGNSSSAHIEVGKQGYAGPDVTDTLCIQDSIVMMNDLIPQTLHSQGGYWQNVITGDTVVSMDLTKFSGNQRKSYHYIAPGTHQCSDTALYTLYFSECTVGFTEFTSTEEIGVFPNPASSFVTVEFPENISLDNKVYLYNANHVIVAQFNLSDGNTLALNNLPKGVYFLMSNTELGTFSSRLIIQ